MRSRGLMTPAAAVMLAAVSATAAPAQQTAQTESGSAQSATDGQQQQDTLKVYFDLGSAAIAADQEAKLDRAARTFRQGDPFVMTVSGGADTVGPAGRNLELSVQRATNVVRALTERGIPIGRLQIVGRGSSELTVDTGDEVANRQNRVAEISWR